MSEEMGNSAPHVYVVAEQILPQAYFPRGHVCGVLLFFTLIVVFELYDWLATKQRQQQRQPKNKRQENTATPIQPAPLLIIGLAGKSGAGKSTVSTFFKVPIGSQPNSWVRDIAFAEPLKRAVMAVFGLTPAQVFDPKYKDTIDERFGKTPRQLLQDTGSLIRKSHWDIFVCRGVEQLTILQKQPDLDIVFISDVRFENEASAIRALGGHILHIERKQVLPDAAKDRHESERGFPKLEQDITVHNHGTLQEFQDTMYAVIDTLRPGIMKRILAKRDANLTLLR